MSRRYHRTIYCVARATLVATALISTYAGTQLQLSFRSYVADTK